MKIEFYSQSFSIYFASEKSPPKLKRATKAKVTGIDSYKIVRKLQIIHVNSHPDKPQIKVELKLYRC